MTDILEGKLSFEVWLGRDLGAVEAVRVQIEITSVQNPKEKGRSL